MPIRPRKISVYTSQECFGKSGKVNVQCPQLREKRQEGGEKGGGQPANGQLMHIRHVWEDLQGT